MRCLPVLLFSSLILLFVCPAQAKDDLTLAKEAFGEGKALFEQGKYDAASEAFWRAYKLKPSWKLLYNIGQSEMEAKRYGLALEAFERYLVEGGEDVDSDRQEQLLKDVKRLRELVGWLEVQAPTDSEIFVDGVSRGRTPLKGALTVEASVDHTVVVMLNGRRILYRVVRVNGGKSLAVSAEQKPPAPEPAIEKQSEKAAPVETPSEEPKEPVKSDRKSTLKAWGWSLFGIGGAVLVGSAATGGMALSIDGDLVKDCKDGCSESRQKDKDKSETLATVTNVLIGTGAAVAATGIILVIVGYGKKKERKSSIAFSPAINADSVWMGLQGSF